MTTDNEDVNSTIVRRPAPLHDHSGLSAIASLLTTPKRANGLNQSLLQIVAKWIDGHRDGQSLERVAGRLDSARGNDRLHGASSDP